MFTNYRVTGSGTLKEGIMKLNLFFAVILAVLIITACGGGGNTPPVIIQTEDGDTADVSEANSGKQTARLSLCGVEVTFTLRYGEGAQVAFDNSNDTSVIVQVDNETSGALVAHKCLWAGNQSAQDAVFTKGDTLTIEVRQGQGQYWHWLCSEFTDEVLNNFPVCDTVMVKIQ